MTMTCKSSTVEPSTKIPVQRVQHAGLITHKCKKEEHRVDEDCECLCGRKWKRNYK